MRLPDIRPATWFFKHQFEPSLERLKELDAKAMQDGLKPQGLNIYYTVKSFVPLFDLIGLFFMFAGFLYAISWIITKVRP